MAASVQSMCQFWKDFNLQQLQRELDTTATELANRQDESEASRKRLVEQSREFKKNTPEDLRKVVAPLLKSFQSEVDSLSKRSKAAEGAFLTVYKQIIDLPDPVPVLEYAQQVQKRAQRVGDLEIENKQLRETLDEYNHEFAEVKNQEVTIKQLRDRLKECDDRAEATAEARTREKERELQRVFAEKERQLQETQLTVAKKLGEAEHKVTALQAELGNVQSEVFEVKSKYDEVTSAKSDEMDMVMSDLERANERVEASEREVEELRRQLLIATQTQVATETVQQAPDMDKAIDMYKRSSLEVELAAKEKEIAQLVEDVQRLQASLNKLRESTSSQVSKLEEELANKNQAFKKLEEKIKSQEDYEEIKRELSVMKSIEFSGSQGKEGGVEEAKSLERLVLEKNKALQSENTTLKVNNAELSESSTPALSENTEAFASIIGEEIVSSYRQSRISTPSTPSTNEDKKETENCERTLSSKVSPKIERVPSIPSDSPHLPPPPSPQFFQYGTGHLLSNYMGMGIIKSEQQTCNSQGIDTSLVAKTVRELLSIHNIGQRLFAKHVLGLSQGTVSELLSKPKSWDKLTEKGRESYRKMYAWATDERNILALKAISPKKGPTTLVSSVQREDAQTEERIAQILNEAQMAMQMKKAMEQAYPQTVAHAYQKEMMRLAQVSVYQGLPSPHSSSNSVTSPTGQGSILSERKVSVLENSRRRESVDSQGSAKEMVERIYKQELMKLAQAAESAGNIAASTMYQQELARLAQNAQREAFTEPGEIRRPRNSPEDMRIKTEPRDGSYDDTMMQSNGPIDLSKHSSNSTPTTPTSPPDSDKSPTQHQASAFFQVKPKMNGHTTPVENKGGFAPQFGQQTECVSPLQRMQNIANSLMARPHMAVSNAKPLKAVLPPITQDQFDKYSNMNTDDLVKKIKETLSQYSISQRLFGENVLGLSQGSVSDLLARPKPWHMLTQKGREPFIRMQIFLEDAEAIPKLVASQYHIPPDKLMRGRPPQEIAQRRRRSSLEERSYDSPSLPKRPRVFFTEEQKEKLRMAYSHDPYPNQNTIEALANELNVGVKTVINWFHNHRMRAKQQQHSGSGSVSSMGDYGSQLKSENNDDNSDQSDISSLSGDTGPYQSSFHGNEASQWLFPKFEPISALKRNSPLEGGENDDDDDDNDDGVVEDDDTHSSRSNSPSPMRLNDDSRQEIKPNMDSDKVFNDFGDSSPLEDGDDVTASHLMHSMTQGSGVNKRKRSNPQYVSEGRQLDKTKTILDGLPSQVSRDEGVSLELDEDVEKENESGNVEQGYMNREHVNKMAKLSNSVDSTEDDWEEFDRKSSIEKLQKNLQQAAVGGSWEF